MTTFGAIAVGWKAARHAKASTRRINPRAFVGIRALAARVADAGFAIGTAGCVTAAAWMVALPLGLLTAGAALLFLEWRMSDDA